MLSPFANAIVNRIAGITAKRSTGCVGRLGMVALQNILGIDVLGLDASLHASWQSDRDSKRSLDTYPAIAPICIAAPTTDFHRIRVSFGGFDRHRRSGIIGSIHLFTQSMPSAT